MRQNQKILIGAITGAHGIKGAVRVRSFATEPDDIFTYSPLSDEKGERVFALHCMGLVKDDFIATIKGIDDRTAAENLRGTKLFVSRDKLPKAKDGEYYEADLQGLEAKTEDGETIGTIEALHDYGAGSFLEIKPQKGPSFMLPFTDAHVPTVDIEKGFATVLIPEGWLNVEKPEKKGKKP